VAELDLCLVISAQDWERMRCDAAQRAPLEACGLLAGRIEDNRYVALEVIPTANQLQSPVRFRIEPHQLLAAFDLIEGRGLELLAIYHSHPNGPDHPSETDVAEAYYPDTIALIWSARGGVWSGKAFLLQSGQAHPVAVRFS
jgi:proteasome lid subunit RPN8/RPN11